MSFIFEPPTSLTLAVLLSIAAIGSAWRGGMLLLKGFRRADHPSGTLWVVRGIRGWIVTLALGAWAAGLLLAKGWVLLVAAIILAEELYETGVVSLALRASDKAEKREASLG
jgi:hypothetical protein